MAVFTRYGFATSNNKQCFQLKTIAFQVIKVGTCGSQQKRDASTIPTNIAAMKRGTGRRASFSGIVATVFGTSGRLAKPIVSRLGKMGSQVILPYRGAFRNVKDLKVCGDLGQILYLPFDLRDEDAIRKAVQHSNVVINLIGKDLDSFHYTMRETNVEGAERIARISKEMGVETFIHFSHLNAREEPSQPCKFLELKYESELAVRKHFPEAIIFKPADMFGTNDRFICHFMDRRRATIFFKFLPLYKGGHSTIKQPVAINNVAEGVINAIGNPDLVGQNIECYGGQRYFLSDIVDFILETKRVNKFIFRTRFLMDWQMMKAKYHDFIKINRPNRYSVQKIIMEGITDEPTNALNLEDLGVQLTRFDYTAFTIVHQRRFLSIFQTKTEELGDFDDPILKPVEYYERIKLIQS